VSDQSRERVSQLVIRVMTDARVRTAVVIAVTIGALVLLLATSATAGSVFPFWLAIVVAWMAFSIVSGAYPWSMRFGGL